MSFLVEIALIVVKQNLLAFTLMQYVTGFIVIKPILLLDVILVFGEHFVQKVSVVVLIFACANCGRVVLDNFLVVVLQ